MTSKIRNVCNRLDSALLKYSEKNHQVFFVRKTFQICVGKEIPVSQEKYNSD